MALLDDKNEKSIVLASASPRRQELLKLIVQDFKVLPIDVDETITAGISLSDMVKELATRKARAASLICTNSIIIASDTLVSVDGLILGKPKDEKDAMRMLKLLSGRIHNVETGVCVISGQKTEIFSVNTQVEFIKMRDSEIEKYIKSGEPMDKAGAYGIQGKGAKYVSGIKGDYYSVMGLPVSKLYLILREKFKIINV